jgi:hypothetical protein
MNSKDYRDEGLLAGALVALIAGQVPPFTALPEEAITVPIFAMAGSMIGQHIRK